MGKKNFNYCCKKNTGDDMIECSGTNARNKCPGRAWFHYSCVNLNSDLAGKFEKYICAQCQLRTGQVSTFTEPELNTTEPELNTTEPELNTAEPEHNTTEPELNTTEPEVEMLPEQNDENTTEQEYAIKHIRSHAIDVPTNQMMLLIEWEGYPDKNDWTWELEHKLTKCYTKVQEYRNNTAELKGTRTILKPIAGADLTKNMGKHNKQNWPTLTQMKIKAKQLLNHKKYKTDLNLIVCTSVQLKKPTKSSLMILHHAAHYYAILWLKPQDRILICDSNNSTLGKDRNCELEKILGQKIETIEIMNRTKIDYCGAATISALMEYSRMYKSGNFSNSLSFSSMYYQRAVTSLHPEKSHAEPGRKNILTVSRILKCEHCEYKTTKGRGALLSHQRQKCN